MTPTEYLRRALKTVRRKDREEDEVLAAGKRILPPPAPMQGPNFPGISKEIPSDPISSSLITGIIPVSSPPPTSPIASLIHVRNVTIEDIPDPSEPAQGTPIPLFFVPSSEAPSHSFSNNQTQGFMANLSSVSPNGPPTHQINLNEVFRAGGMPEPNSQNVASLVRHMLSPEEEENFRKLSFSAQRQKVKSDFWTGFCQLQYITESIFAKFQDMSTIIENQKMQLSRGQNKIRKANQLHNRTQRELEDCRAELAKEKSRGKARMEVLEAELNAEKKKNEALEAELVAEKKKNSFLQQESSDKDEELERVPHKIDWWRKKTTQAVNAGFLDYCGLEKFNASDIAPYTNKRLAEIDESKVGLPSSDEEKTDDDAEYEDLPLSDDPYDAEDPAAKSFPPPLE